MAVVVIEFGKVSIVVVVVAQAKRCIQFLLFVLLIVLALSRGVVERLQVEYSPKTIDPIVKLLIGRCCRETNGGSWHCGKTGLSLDGTGVSFIRGGG